MNIEEFLNNKNNIYFAHGTGTNKKEIIESIMNHGVRCSHDALQFTSIYLGEAQNIKSDGKDILENWEYKNSNIVVIISLPKKYFILEAKELNTLKKEQAAYYYYPTEEEQKTYSLINKPHIYKEFIVGYYNSNTKEFVKNPNYYEYKSKEEQDKIFKIIENNYVNIIEKNCTIEKYKNELKKYNISYALDNN